jgi:hypothetical protein
MQITKNAKTCQLRATSIEREFYYLLSKRKSRFGLDAELYLFSFHFSRDFALLFSLTEQEMTSKAASLRRAGGNAREKSNACFREGSGNSHEKKKLSTW